MSHSVCMPIRAHTLQCISLWFHLQCSYVHLHHRSNTTQPVHCTTIQSVKDSAAQDSTVQHGSVLYLKKMSRAESDLHPVWLSGPIKDVSRFLSRCVLSGQSDATPRAWVLLAFSVCLS